MNKKNLSINMPQIAITKTELEKLSDLYFLNKDESLLNYNKCHRIELKDMGNDRETWFVTEVTTGQETEIADYNYRNKPSYVDYSHKYGVFFYILCNWNYKRGSHYYLHMHYKGDFYETYLGHDSYTKMTISPCGEKLLVSIRNIGLYEISLKDLVEALDKDIPLTKGEFFLDKEELQRKRDKEITQEEAKISYGITYPDEYGDD